MEPRDVGRAAGRALAVPGPIIAAMISAIDLERRERLAFLKTSLEAASRQQRNALEVSQRAGETLAQSEHRRDSLLEDRAAQPARYSLPRTFFYLAIGVFAIVGDIAFLGGVLASLLGSFIVTEDGTSFTTLLVTQPFNALAQFPDLSLLTLSVLTSGFVLKLWYQHVERQNAKSQVWFKCLSVGLCLALIALMLLSAVRLQIPVGGTTKLLDTRLARAATAVLGLSLPLLASFFLIEAFDSVGRRIELWRACVSTRCRHYYWKRAVGREQKFASQLETIQADIAALADESVRISAKAKSRVDFGEGYREGTALALGPTVPGSLYNALRTSVIAHLSGVTR